MIRRPGTKRRGTPHSPELVNDIYRVSAFWAAVIAIAVLSSSTTYAQTVVSTRDGKLAGTTAAGVTSFKGIPFAAPPVGDLRWRPPQPPKPWSGVHQATAFPAACPQKLVRSQLPWTEAFMNQVPMSEDCLYLNVWAPTTVSEKSARSAKSLPVYVFIHGGAFNQGSTSVAVYNGAPLAAKGVIVVTIQYRLGVLGFLAHPALTAESPNYASGNYGLLDCLAALRWVHEDITAFGGDPSRVTVGGQSAGAAAVHDLLASPMTRGLVAGAIAESGSSITASVPPLRVAEQDGLKLATLAGAKDLAALRALPPDRLVAVAAGMRLAPVIDGWSLPEDPTAALANGRTLDVPILTGMQADEGSSSPTYAHVTAANLRSETSQHVGAQEQRFETLYPFSTDAEATQQSKASARDRGLASMELWASLTAAHNRSPVYTYYWAHVLPWPEHPEFGSFHSSELPYILGTLDVLPRPYTAEDRKLSAEAMNQWASFIRTGSPNGAGLPLWKPLQAHAPETMIIDTTAGIRTVMDAEHLAFWRSILH